MSWIMSSRLPDANFGQKQVYLVFTFRSTHSNKSYFHVVLFIMLDKVVLAFLAVE